MNTTILYNWEKRQLATQPLFFTVRYRTINTDWQNFRAAESRLVLMLLTKAEEMALVQSTHYINSLVGVFVGDSNKVISLWEDGECLWKDYLSMEFQDTNYQSKWE